MIKIYRKTATIKAEQFDGSEEMIELYDMGFQLAPNGKGGAIIKTLEGDLLVHVGDWIATGVNGEHWIIPNALYEQQYGELPVISKELDTYIQLYKRKGYGITDMLYDLNDEVCPDVHLTKDDIARAWLDGYQVEEDDD
ncbi:hypothetical protein [Lactiplantibacillus plantarum]|uniref:hypothetical protein n=1 Tax=Lactiplantibacillus plantarum TaxID=1590 RepID=UPI001C01984F|nr:hypothetical protein [Lactiplantibacillus plantarum]